MKIARAAVAGGILAAALAAAPAALAAGPANAEQITGTCSNGATYDVWVPFGGNGPASQNDFTPAHIVGTDEVIVPYEFTWTATDTSTGVSQTQVVVKGSAPAPSGAITCTFPAGANGTIVYTGSVLGVIR